MLWWQVPIVLGITLVAATELAFDARAFVIIGLSNLAFAFRATLAKKLQHSQVGWDDLIDELIDEFD